MRWVHLRSRLAAALVLCVSTAASSQTALAGDHGAYLVPATQYGAAPYAGAPMYYGAAPSYYGAAPSYYGAAPNYTAPGYTPQPGYYLLKKHHKTYLVPAAAPAAGAAPYGYGYAAPAAAPAATPTTASAAPAATPTTAGTAAAAPSTESTALVTEFRLKGAIKDAFLDDLRRFYISSTDTQGFDRVRALREQAETLYNNYMQASGSPVDTQTGLSPGAREQINDFVEQVVSEDRARLGHRSRRHRDYDDEDNDDDDYERVPVRYFTYPAPTYYPAPPMYVIRYRVKHGKHGH